MAERTIYLNRDFVPESEAKVSVMDWGFSGGDAVYEVTRSFNHALFRFEDHLSRLYRTLTYARIDCGLDASGMAEVSRETFERNKPLLGDNEDYALWHVISRGHRLDEPDMRPTVVIYCLLIDFGRFARDYIDGAIMVTPATRRTPPECVDAKAKLTNRANQMQALFEAKQTDPRAIPLMLDVHGNIAESNTANFFFISDGRLCTSRARNVLGGITRKVVFELAEAQGLEVVEGDFTPYDVYNAEEAFTSGTSATILPVGSLNGAAFDGGVPGPVTLRLIRAWNDLIGSDYVAQAMMQLGDNERKSYLAAWDERLGAVPA